MKKIILIMASFAIIGCVSPGPNGCCNQPSEPKWGDDHWDEPEFVIQ